MTSDDRTPSREDNTVDLTPRLLQHIQRQFPEPGSAAEVARLLRQMFLDLPATNPGTERLCTAVLILTNGNAQSVHRWIREAQTDWRDVLVSANLAHANWPARLDVLLGPATR